MSVAFCPEQMVLALPATFAMTGAVTEIFTVAVLVQSPFETNTE